jgi:hypothetical protein
MGFLVQSPRTIEPPRCRITSDFASAKSLIGAVSQAGPCDIAQLDHRRLATTPREPFGKSGMINPVRQASDLAPVCEMVALQVAPDGPLQPLDFGVRIRSVAAGRPP